MLYSLLFRYLEDTSSNAGSGSTKELRIWLKPDLPEAKENQDRHSDHGVMGLDCWSCLLCLGFPVTESEKKAGDKRLNERGTIASTSQGDIRRSTRETLDDPHCEQCSAKGFGFIFLFSPVFEGCCQLLCFVRRIPEPTLALLLEKVRRAKHDVCKDYTPGYVPGGREWVPNFFWKFFLRMVGGEKGKEMEEEWRDLSQGGGSQKR